MTRGARIAWPAVALACIGAAALGAGVALSVPSQNGPKVYACVSDSSTPLKIAAGIPPTCTGGDSLISWSQDAAQPLSAPAQAKLGERLSADRRMLGTESDALAALRHRVAGLTAGDPTSSEIDQRLQRILDKQNRVYGAISNIMKNHHDTLRNTIQNLK
jgi:hypothetical protein